MCRPQQTAWRRALTFFLLISTGVSALSAAPSPGLAAGVSPRDERAGQVAGQDTCPTPQSAALVIASSPDHEPRDVQPTPRLPALPPVPPSSRPLRLDTGYIPSGIPFRDLPADGQLTRLNIRLDPQDPHVVGPRLEATLRAHNERRGQQAGVLAPPSPEMQALAAGLDNDPQLIYEYVHNHYDFVPTWGLVKSPEETYLAKAGNAFDLAALLVALLRAAGYEAEFAFGNVRLSPDQFTNWVGVTDMQAALWVFWNGGIAAEMVINGFSVEHVWTRVKIAGTWHPLDPSFKSYTTRQPLDLATLLGYDRNGFLASAQTGSTVQANYVRNINEANINGRLAQYGTNLATHLRANLSFAYLHEVIGGREILPETLDGYPTELPYTVLESRGTAQEIPGDLVHRLHIQLPGIDYRANLPDVAGERITIFYGPATAADQAAIDAAGSIYDVYPAYQVNMKPELRVGGNVAATGQAVSLGSTQRLDVTVVTPIDDGEGNPVLLQYAPQNLRAGQWYALPMKLQTVSDEQLHRHQLALEESLAAGLDAEAEPVLGQSLFTLGMAYLHQTNLSDRLSAQVAGVVRVPFVSGMLVSQDIAVLEWQQVGAELKANRLGVAAYSIDVRLEFVAFVSTVGNADRERGLSI
ncbi:MAG TPA: transglutaminase domain-containing protein, partial [Anaerolineae bacterium]|nr:transglutaminase domain-containing protein [Anaerolineae bacterium]